MIVMRKKNSRHNSARIRLCLCSGPWHLVSLRASILTREKKQGDNATTYDTYLIIQGSDWQKQLREDLLKSAKASQHWREVINIDDALDITSADQLSKLKHLLGSLGLPSHVTELWLPHFWPHIPRVAAEVWKTANIYLYEEGLSTYNTFSVASYPQYLIGRLRKLARSLVRGEARAAQVLASLRSTFDRRNVIWSGGAVKEHIKRTRESYIFLDGCVPLSSNHPDSIDVFPIDRDILHDVLDPYGNCADIFDITKREGKPKVLFLGQNLSRHSALSSEDELELFRTVVQSIINAGYQVIWKDHPRAVPPLCDKIKQIAPDDVCILPELQYCPIEAILPKLGISFCVGVWSTTLFYAKAIYGIESYTIASRHKDLIHGNDRLMEWLDLTSRHIPDLDEKLNLADSILPIGRSQTPS